MLTKRIIPCLDIKDGRVVKGVNFENIADAGNPIELASYYAKNGADEIVFLDITATNEKRKTLCDLVKKIAQNIDIPFAVGGGINSEEDVIALLDSGADKISINSSAIKNPKLITNLANRFGSQCVIVAIDIKFEDNEWWVFSNGGKIKTNLKAISWAKKVEELGGGEILLTSMNNDGTKGGFALEITKEISNNAKIPIIASGGAGKIEDFKDVFLMANADAALAASIFHYGEVKINDLKKYLKSENINVRI